MSAFFLYLCGPETELYLGDNYIKQWSRKSLQNMKVKITPARNATSRANSAIPTEIRNH
jgi:hypothetical protein